MGGYRHSANQWTRAGPSFKEESVMLLKILFTMTLFSGETLYALPLSKTSGGVVAAFTLGLENHEVTLKVLPALGINDPEKLDFLVFDRINQCVSFEELCGHSVPPSAELSSDRAQFLYAVGKKISVDLSAYIVKLVIAAGISNVIYTPSLSEGGRLAQIEAALTACGIPLPSLASVPPSGDSGASTSGGSQSFDW
ncbi:hypothetical protein L1049_016496 [Liquidambar formosana]|uniref:Uncharacterized protein n=1 Tax=Liquidambar formosana TaxID=63359 RepID=A0AAP0S6F6_LIQFO